MTAKKSRITMFKQIAIPFWPSRDFRPLFEVFTSVEELSRRLNVCFYADEDDLGPGNGCVLEVDDIGSVLLHQYTQGPNHRVAIYCDAGLTNQITFDLIVKAVGFSNDEISWMRSDIELRTHPDTGAAR
jgi:hypothetical protein